MRKLIFPFFLIGLYLLNAIFGLVGIYNFNHGDIDYVIFQNIEMAICFFVMVISGILFLVELGMFVYCLATKKEVKYHVIAGIIYFFCPAIYILQIFIYMGFTVGMSV